MDLSLKVVILKKLLGITFDSDFTFEEKLCQKASQNLHALSRISQYSLQHKKQILLKTLTMPQCNYCPLVWMCHSRGLNNKINNKRKRALRISNNQDKNQIYRIY